MTACDSAAQTTIWHAMPSDAARPEQRNLAPVIGDEDIHRIGAIGVWDAWPVLTRNGALAPSGLWMALAAPWFADPDARHGAARIHLLQRTAAGWLDLGPAMPGGFSPGSREWSGCTCLEADGRTLTLYFTAAGHRGESRLSFDQRLFEAKATATLEGGRWRLENWRDLKETMARDPRFYMDPAAVNGAAGTIKAFRDPGYFLDPNTGRHWLLFTASLASSRSAFNGSIGAAVAAGDEPGDWEVLPPLISADGLNNELERPHIVFANNLYYLFWSTQSHVFNPEGPVGPTGLYGMVARTMSDLWTPLNGSGLVIANPPQAPRQAYSWYVLPDLSVTSFVDDWGRTDDAEGKRRFGGSFAPFLHLELDGATARIVGKP